MDVNVHDVKEVTMNREMLEEGYELLTMKIKSDGSTLRIKMYAEHNDFVRLDLRGIGLGAYTVE